MKKYSILLFDADGTLFDFDKAEIYALEKSLLFFQRDFKIDFHLANYRDINSKIWKDFEKGLITAEELKIERFRRFIIRINEDMDAKLFAEKYLEFLSETAFLIKGVENLLAELYKEYRMLLLTNGLAKVQRKRLSLSPIREYFEGIVISEELGIAKPDPRIFRHSLEILDFTEKDKVIIIGDSLSSDIKGGISYGIDTCWYNPHNNNVSEEYQPTYQIKNLKELREILL